MSQTRIMHHGVEQQLRDKMQRLEQEIADLRLVMGQDRAVEPDIADRACTAASQDWNMIRYNRSRALLKDIAVALQAIENDAYGVCELCGEHIADRRLLAVPGARFCIDCQEMVDLNPGEFTRTGLGGDYRTAV